MNTKTIALSIALACVLLVTSGCGPIGSLLGGGGGAQAGGMWADVPVMEGMTKENVDLPLPIRLAVQALVRASASSEGVRLDNFEVLTFTSAKTPDDIKAFYTDERMRAAGWDMAGQPGCTGMNNASSAGATFCLFGKQNPANKSLLVLAATRNENETTMTVFFMRFEGDIVTTPAGS
ncbi:MAG: hypothetical protein KatS3mg052_1306 [Candidatus Roseilinea sp.]|nr:MAG: hypothetical protein KatS3mg052_1306 [Candidatus Roseilinea sp.]